MITLQNVLERLQSQQWEHNKSQQLVCTGALSFYVSQGIFAPTAVGAPPPKKCRLSGLTGATVRDVSYAEASKLATVHEFNFFDRARKALRSQHVYDNFLR